jgi:cell division protein FtsL
MKKPRLILLILFTVTIILSLIKIFVINNIATSGILLSKVQEEVNKYKLENSEISSKIYSLSSLTYINSKARELGYTEDFRQLVLTNQPVAFKQ